MFSTSNIKNIISKTLHEATKQHPTHEFMISFAKQDAAVAQEVANNSSSRQPSSGTEEASPLSSQQRGSLLAGGTVDETAAITLQRSPSIAGRIDSARFPGFNAAMRVQSVLLPPAASAPLALPAADATQHGVARAG
jgi:hypothetical protein